MKRAIELSKKFAPVRKLMTIREVTCKVNPIAGTINRIRYLKILLFIF